MRSCTYPKTIFNNETKFTALGLNFEIVLKGSQFYALIFSKYNENSLLLGDSALTRIFLNNAILMVPYNTLLSILRGFCSSINSWISPNSPISFGSKNILMGFAYLLKYFIISFISRYSILLSLFKPTGFYFQNASA